MILPFPEAEFEKQKEKTETSSKIKQAVKKAKAREGKTPNLYINSLIPMPVNTPSDSKNNSGTGYRKNEKPAKYRKRAKKQRSAQKRDAPFPTIESAKEAYSISNLPGTSAAPRSVEMKYNAKKTKKTVLYFLGIFTVFVLSVTSVSAGTGSSAISVFIVMSSIQKYMDIRQTLCQKHTSFKVRI